MDSIQTTDSSRLERPQNWGRLGIAALLLFLIKGLLWLIVPIVFVLLA